MIQPTNELYKSVKGTIRKAANRVSCNYRVDFDDALSAANEMFMDACAAYDESRGIKFNSWLTTRLMGLKDWFTYRKNVMFEDEVENELNGSNDMNDSWHNNSSIFGNMLDNTSKKLSDNHVAGDSWFERLKGMDMYLNLLDKDAVEMFNDILDGHMERNSCKEVVRLAGGFNITPRQMYLRRYCRKGWDMERVKKARMNLQSVLDQWRHGKLPSKIIHKETNVEELF